MTIACCATAAKLTRASTPVARWMTSRCASRAAPYPMMVSAKPKRPKAPPEKWSWIRPTNMPANRAASELDSRPWRTTTTRNTSITWVNRGISASPRQWNRTAAATAAKNLRALKRRGLPELLGNRLVRDLVDLVERAEVDGGGDLDVVEELPPLADGGDGADRDAARIDAVDPGGLHGVARPHVRLERHEIEIEGPGPPAAAAHDPLPAGAQDHGAHAGGAVGDELHLGVGARRGHHPAHQAVGGEHRLVDPRRGVAGIDQQRAQPRGVVHVDDVRGADAADRGREMAHRLPEAAGLALHVVELEKTQLQVLHLAAQPPVLVLQPAPRAQPLAEADHVPGQARHRPRRRTQQAQAQRFEERVAL